MKLIIELNCDTVAQATYIQSRAEAVIRFEKQITTSAKTKREMLDMFNADFDLFRQFVYAALSSAQVAVNIRECRLNDSENK